MASAVDRKLSAYSNIALLLARILIALLFLIASYNKLKGLGGSALLCPIHQACQYCGQAEARNLQKSAALSVAVGMAVTDHPPHRPVLAGTTAYGSYLGCDAARRLASKRASG